MWGLLSAIAAGALAVAAQFASVARYPRAYKQLASLVDIWHKVPKGSDADDTLARLVNLNALAIEKRTADRHPLNPTNVALTILLSAGLGYGTYRLWVWAMSGVGWTVGAWILFVFALLATLLFIGGGVGTFRNPSSAKAKGEK